jgi:PIN domain nuclease of toxin-antitoxin system
VTLLDAYGLVALLLDEPAAPEIEEILRGGDARVVIVNLAETIDVARRVHDLDADNVRATIEPLLAARALTPVASNADHAWLAAELRSAHYDRRTSALSLADCLLLAHGVSDGDGIATADPSLATAARSEGLDVIALPDSAGVRP